LARCRNAFEIRTEDTQLGIETVQMADAVRDNLGNLDEQTLASLQTAIQEHDQENGPNII
jgi:hydroxyethylthiazole kinase-like sugar kinase family protein